MTLHATRNRNDDTVTVHATYGAITVQVKEQRGHALGFWHDLGKLIIDDTEDRAAKGYQRYVEHCGGVSVHGDELPDWENLPQPIQEHWIAAFTE